MKTGAAVLSLTVTCQPVAGAPLDSGAGRFASISPPWLKNPPPVARSPALHVADAVPIAPAAIPRLVPQRWTTVVAPGAPAAPAAPVSPFGHWLPAAPDGPAAPA